MQKTNKKIIVYYRNFTPIIEAFEALGYEVIEEPDYIFSAKPEEVELMLICMYNWIKTPILSLRRCAAARELGTPIIAWNRDGPANKGEKSWRQWLLRSLPYMDIYASHTMQHAEHFGKEQIYLPNAAWHTQYNLQKRTLPMLRTPSNYLCDVSFFGRFDATRYPEMKQRQDFLLALASRLDQLGISHRFVDHDMTIEQQVDFIQTSRINLNYHAGCDTAFHGTKASERSWGMPERCFGVQACGGLLLSDYRRHAVDDFQHGINWLDFSDLEDCVAQICYYLQNFSAARDIAESGYQHVMQHHTYHHRANALLSASRAWRMKQKHCSATR